MSPPEPVQPGSVHSFEPRQDLEPLESNHPFVEARTRASGPCPEMSIVFDLSRLNPGICSGCAADAFCWRPDKSPRRD
jgi:hypothetical protein